MNTCTHWIQDTDEGVGRATLSDGSTVGAMLVGGTLFKRIVEVKKPQNEVSLGEPIELSHKVKDFLFRWAQG